MPRNGNGNGMLKSLTVYDFSDRELLLILMEEAERDADGYASTQSIAERLGMDVKHPNNNAGVRLGFLKKIGAVEKDPESDAGQGRWAVTPIGKLMATGEIKKTAQRQLDGLGPEAMLLLTRFVGQRSLEAPSETASRLIKREWRHITGAR